MNPKQPATPAEYLNQLRSAATETRIALRQQLDAYGRAIRESPEAAEAWEVGNRAAARRAAQAAAELRVAETMDRLWTEKVAAGVTVPEPSAPLSAGLQRLAAHLLNMGADAYSR